MPTPRGPSSGDPSRAERAEAAARRLALLAADLGVSDPRSGTWPGGADDFTRVVPSKRLVPPDESVPLPAPAPPGSTDGPVATVEPAVLPRPGRHAARRVLPRLTRAVGLSGLHVTVLALMIAGGIGFTAWWVVRAQTTAVEPGIVGDARSADPLVAPSGPDVATGATVPVSDGTVTVDVTGKVRRPGIVVLDAGARVVDALEAAGGERAGVDLSTLNLARVLVDGEQVVVGAESVPAPVLPSGSAPSGAPVALVNLNTATPVELETLPDIGPVTAAAIVAWRDEHGGFTSVDQLLEVSGIGEATLGTVAPYVTV